MIASPVLVIISYLFLVGLTTTTSTPTPTPPTPIYCDNGTHVIINGTCVTRASVIVRKNHSEILLPFFLYGVEFYCHHIEK